MIASIDLMFDHPSLSQETFLTCGCKIGYWQARGGPARARARERVEGAGEKRGVPDPWLPSRQRWRQQRRQGQGGSGLALETALSRPCSLREKWLLRPASPSISSSSPLTFSLSGHAVLPLLSFLPLSLTTMPSPHPLQGNVKLLMDDVAVLK